MNFLRSTYSTWCVTIDIIIMTMVLVAVHIIIILLNCHRDVR